MDGERGERMESTLQVRVKGEEEPLSPYLPFVSISSTVL
jgi:hypothetical protein